MCISHHKKVWLDDYNLFRIKIAPCGVCRSSVASLQPSSCRPLCVNRVIAALLLGLGFTSQHISTHLTHQKTIRTQNSQLATKFALFRGLVYSA